MHLSAQARPWVIGALVVGVLWFLARRPLGDPYQRSTFSLVPVLPVFVAPPAIDPSTQIPPYVENAGQYGFRVGGTTSAY